MAREDRALRHELAVLPDSRPPFPPSDRLTPDTSPASAEDGAHPDADAVAEDRDAPAIFKEVGDFAALGGDLLFGTDVGFHQMYDPRLEFASLARAGLAWRQVLASLTTVPARRLDPDRTRGQVAQGLAGNVVVLGGDPALDPLALTDVRVTVRTGRVIFQRGRYQST